MHSEPIEIGATYEIAIDGVVSKFKLYSRPFNDEFGNKYMNGYDLVHQRMMQVTLRVFEKYAVKVESKMKPAICVVCGKQFMKLPNYKRQSCDKPCAAILKSRTGRAKLAVRVQEVDR